MRARTIIVMLMALAFVASGCGTTIQNRAPATMAGEHPSQEMTGMTAPVSGTVVRVDEPNRVVVLDDGRMYRVTGDQAIVVDNRPVVIGAVRPGTRVVMNSAAPVYYQNGQYVIVPAAAPVGAVRQTVYGRVTDIDRDGEVTVKTAKGEIEMRVPPAVVGNIREGDSVTLDVTIVPVAPAASPRR